MALKMEGILSEGMQVASRTWKRQGNEFSPRASWKEYSPAHTLIWAKKEPCQIYDP